MKTVQRILSIVFIVLIAVSCKDKQSENGDNYFKNGDYQKAIEAYTQYLSLEPTHVKSLYNRGRAYEEIGKPEKALEDFNKVLKEDPENSSALLSITSDLYYRQHNYENTIFYAEKVTKIGESAVAETLKGKAYQKLGKLSEALSAYNGAISVNKEYADAYLSRGSLRTHLNQMSKACADLRIAESLGAESAKALITKYCN